MDASDWNDAQRRIDAACANAHPQIRGTWDARRRPLLSPGASNAKTRKQAAGLRSAIVYLSPAGIASRALADVRERSVCSHSTNCESMCLDQAGRGQLSVVRAARLGKAVLFLEKRPLFLAKLRAEVTRHVRLAERAGVMPVLRLNGTSDVPYEDLAPGLFADHPNLQAMDYTKNERRYRACMAGRTMAGRPWPDNLHLCYSRSELTPDKTVRDILGLGGTVAVVFRNRLPATWLGHVVNDATKNDWRWRDVPGQIQGLVALGPAEHDDSGFVVDAD